MPLPWLDPEHPAFPAPETALRDPNGLLAAGGALSPDWLTLAYRHGIFPWFEEDQPILWWSPDPRLVLFPQHLHLSRSLRKLIRKNPYVLTMDRDFSSVVDACAGPRQGAGGTWITDHMRDAYQTLHVRGLAHSVEVWDGNRLVGGLYGVALGKVFFGESMFSRQSNTSKLALAWLVSQLRAWGFALIDCQVSSPHLRSLGAEEISRARFNDYLDRYATVASTPGSWQFDEALKVIDDEH